MGGRVAWLLVGTLLVCFPSTCVVEADQLQAVDGTSLDEQTRMGAGSGAGPPDLPAPYDKETESAKMAWAAKMARKQNSLYHPIYTAALKNISDAQREKGYPQVPQPAGDQSVHPDDAELNGAAERRGIDGGRARPKGEFKKLWKQREDLIDILNAIKSSSKPMQVAKHKDYVDTEEKLKVLEAQLGKPYDKAADAIHRMEVAAKQYNSKGMSQQYLAAQAELQEAFKEGPPIPSGMFKDYLQNKGHAMDNSIDAANWKRLSDGHNHQRNVEHQQFKVDLAERNARHDYEAAGGKRPGCAYINGPCDHSEKDVPGPPLVPAAHYIQPFSSTLSWQVPQLNRAFVTGYRIMFRKGDTGEWEKITLAHGGMQHIMKKVRGLEAGTKYEFRIQALYVHAKIRQMSIREISRELQLYGKGSYAAAQQGDKNALITRLNRVLGEPAGPPSKIVHVVTPKAAPAKPMPPIVQGLSYTTNAYISAKLSWTPPNPNGGKITGYQILKAQGGDLWGWQEVVKNTFSSEPEFTVTGLEANGVGYMFKIAAINEIGRSGYSKPSKTAATLPTKPAGLVGGMAAHGIACRGLDCGWRLDWKTPLANGAAVTGYQIRYQTDGKGPFKIKIRNTQSSKTTALINGMQGGRTYRVRVIAWNGQGWGKLDSPVLVVKTPAGVPGRPRKPVWGNVGEASLKLSWNAPPPNGSPITGYRITYQEGGTGGFFEKIRDTKSVDAAVMITDLKTGGVAYEFKVEAYNSVGLGPASKPSDAAQTKYSSVHATKKATTQAHENFKVTHKLYTLRQLDIKMKLYKSHWLDMQKRFRMAKERGQKAETEVAQLQESHNLEGALRGKELALERDLAIRKVKHIDTVDYKKKTLNSLLAQKKLEHSHQLATERLMDQRKHYDKLLAHNHEEMDKQKDEIWLLNKKLQKEKELRKAVQDKMRSSSRPQSLKESRISEKESSEPDAQKLKAVFNAAISNAAADFDQNLSLKTKPEPDSAPVAGSSIKLANGNQAQVLKSSFLMQPHAAKVESTEVQELGEH